MAMFGGEGGGGFSAGYPATGYPPLAPYAAAATRCPGAPPPMQAGWSGEENRIFEGALVEFGEGRADRWQRIAERIPGKSPWEVEQQYRRLEKDVLDIEAGIIDPPLYADDCQDFAGAGDPEQGRISFSRPRAKPEERKKGVPWTEDEHKRFLEGLEKYGKGDWRSISRNSVVTRTPTQVASHAQKYFLRLNTEGKKERRRSSIHDVTRT
ncbi:unnamed protein product [Spirodela intermedia]|uniref:Uncharacterized protein n=1 Tax=Spirodela intermedia TaxID=51605 RepID=A0A7I8L4W1_SPIIN|nr:unnamed protein product [Spirodela intermedia]